MNYPNPGGITILGLGPGDPDDLTCKARKWLDQLDEIYLRTIHHPTVAGFSPSLRVYSFDSLYDQNEKFEDVYRAIVQQILDLGGRPQGVTYGVPGHPFVAEATTPEIVRLANETGIPVRIIDGISFLEPTCTALKIDPLSSLAVVDAMEIISGHTPLFSSDKPALIGQIYDQFVAAQVKVVLNTIYPDFHPVKMVHAAGTSNQVVEEIALYQIDRSPHIGLLSSLWVPPLGEGTSLESFQEVVAHLRAPDGCPWDLEQTHLSLRKHLLEETYEAIDALDVQDMAHLREELGDLLLQIVLHAQIATEEQEFTLAEVIQGIYQKIVRRHPHVFGDVSVDGTKAVLQNWERLKEQERKENGKAGEKGILDSIPKALPSLIQAQEYQDRVGRVGFDWPNIQGVWDKLEEEIQEVRQATSAEEQSRELGDVLFALVNLVRWHKVDAETILRETNQRFKARFSRIEAEARNQGKSVSDFSLEEMEAIWQKAK
jgi:tetrapyrrole methylase family protein/MazG family protein